MDFTGGPGGSKGEYCFNNQPDECFLSPQFRYNFSSNRGEVKIDREFRQRCSQSLAAPVVHPWQFPLLEEGQAGWMMKKLSYKIKKRYYDDWVPGPRTQIINPWRAERQHHREDCEACSLSRCPYHRTREDPNMRKGRQGNNMNNLEQIKWVLLDENDHAFHL